MTSSFNLCVDINVVLEILTKRPNAEICIDTLHKFEILFLSPTSVHIAFYFGKKYNFSKDEIAQFLKSFTILPCDESDYLYALKICSDQDVEDALQIAVAKKANIKKFYTLDQKMKQNYQNIIDFI